MNTSFFKTLLFCFTAILFASCDKDFNEIGADIIGDDHFGFDLDEATTIVAFNQKIGTVQSNNLPVNALGYYNNPVFGATKASFVTQVELASVNPTIGVNPVISKVVLAIPYFSTKTATDSETGNGTYRLDSIRGAGNIKLDVFASNYYLRDLDPSTDFTQIQPYYNSQSENNFDNNIADLNRLNNSTNAAQNDQFKFDPSEIINYTTNEDTGEQEIESREAPKMKLDLRTNFFQDKIFGGGAAGKLINNNVFKDYFRGLYFKAENLSDQGTLAQMNFRAGTITVTYDIDKVTVTNGVSVTTREEKTLTINLTGNTVNLLENTDNPDYLSAVNSFNQVDGDPKLYLKGGQGAISVIDLFGPDNDGDGTADQLEQLRANKWLINEANLVFYIDEAAMASAPEPNRIYLYDLDNGIPLVDYYLDGSTASDSKNNKSIHSGILVHKVSKNDLGQNVNGRGISYKIRITNHIRNLIAEGSEVKNVRLGLAVTESILNVANSKLKTPILSTVKTVPSMSVANPLGTVLFGNNIQPGDTNYGKRLKLQIYYTKID